MKLSEEQRIANRKASAKRWVEANKEKVYQKNSEWRLANRERRHAQQRERAQNFKIKAIAYLGGKCAHCNGDFHSSVYDFHHVNPAEKEFEISKILSHSWENIKLELDKCILLCANCHRLEHNKG